MSDIAVEVHNLGKLYRIGGKEEKYSTLRDSVVKAAAAPYRRVRAILRGESAAAHNEEIWALNDISFQVKHGEVVGIIGRNGAGKSTLLKILSRITEPTTGHALVYGRVGALLEVGTGFHPELTGRENVFLNGAILGMSRAEIERKFDEIVDFAGVEAFIDTPVKHYSSGMGLRLGFAVAAHLEPEILIVDEVLAVGDVEFQRKCLGKMSQVAGEGRTVLFVSHQLQAVESLCTRAIMLQNGRILLDGDVQSIIESYVRSISERSVSADRWTDESDRGGNGTSRFRSIRILDKEGHETTALPMGVERFSIELTFECRSPLRNPSFALRLQNTLKVDIVSWRTHETLGEMPGAERGGCVRLNVEGLNLLPGSYFLSVAMNDGGQVIDLVEQCAQIEIVPRSIYNTGKLPDTRRSLIFTPCTWDMDYS
ncbi:MAG: ABC transporter ATP-binding protein [Chloroflexi bacterium]|nr:ABC transporter ATP-binding protein [Chloroflexota bacterium]